MNIGLQDKKIKYIYLPLIVIIVALVLLANISFPLFSQIQDMRTEDDKNKEYQVRLENKIKKLKTLDEATIRNNFETAIKFLPSEKDAMAIFSSINQAQTKNNCHLYGFSLSPGKITKKDTSSSVSESQPSIQEPVEPSSGLYGQLDFKISLDCPKINYLSFLDNLSKIYPVFNINSLVISSLTSDTKILLSLTTYHQQLPTQLGQIDTPLPEMTADYQQVLAQADSYRNLGILTGDSYFISNTISTPSAAINIFSM
jgi:hypothetical protein